MLSVDNIDVYYGKIQAINSVSLQVGSGQLVVLLGANGTGKTTMLNTISGFLRARKGSITYKAARIDKMQPDKVVKAGIVQVSQSRDLFPDMTVADNLYLGAVLENDHNVVAASFERAFQYFPKLKDRSKQLAGSLSGGEQQMLAIGRALMSRPDLIMLDEPSTGLAPLIVEHIMKIVKSIQGEGLTILLVEQNALMATAIADYFYILREGEIVAEGSPDALPEDRQEFFRRYYI